MLSLKCRLCCRPFSTKDSRAKYCSQRCAKSALGATLRSRSAEQRRAICQCGNPFDRGPPSRGRKRCDSCVARARNLMSPRSCVVCDNVFKPRNPKSRFCSIACGGKGRRDAVTAVIAGIELSVAELSRIAGIDETAMRARIKAGGIDKSLLRPKLGQRSIRAGQKKGSD